MKKKKIGEERKDKVKRSTMTGEERKSKKREQEDGREKEAEALIEGRRSSEEERADQSRGEQSRAEERYLYSCTLLKTMRQPAVGWLGGSPAPPRLASLSCCRPVLSYLLEASTGSQGSLVEAVRAIIPLSVPRMLRDPLTVREC